MNLGSTSTVVTGADGFIGSHLVESLVRAGAEVTAFCYYNSFNSRGWLESVPTEVASEVRVIMGDVRDSDGVRSALRGMDSVFHLAALIGIPYSYEAPSSYVATNVTGTLNVMQAAREHELDRVVITSTSEVYGTARTVPIRESHPRQPQSPYSATKIAADALAESFHLAYGSPVTIVRPFNTFGPRQSLRAIIPTVITQLMQGEGLLRLGATSPTRDLTYVTDTCEGFIRVAESDAAIGRDVNLGTGREISVGDLALLIGEVMGVDVTIERDDARLRPDASEVDRLLADNTLALQLADWKPIVSLEEGLRRTVDWFRDSNGASCYRSGEYVV